MVYLIEKSKFYQNQDLIDKITSLGISIAIQEPEAYADGKYFYYIDVLAPDAIPINTIEKTTVLKKLTPRDCKCRYWGTFYNYMQERQILVEYINHHYPSRSMNSNFFPIPFRGYLL